jgi:hypothetical protein
MFIQSPLAAVKSVDKSVQTIECTVFKKMPRKKTDFFCGAFFPMSFSKNLQLQFPLKNTVRPPASFYRNECGRVRLSLYGNRQNSLLKSLTRGYYSGENDNGRWNKKSWLEGNSRELIPTLRTNCLLFFLVQD